MEDFNNGIKETINRLIEKYSKIEEVEDKVIFAACDNLVVFTLFTENGGDINIATNQYTLFDKDQTFDIDLLTINDKKVKFQKYSIKDYKELVISNYKKLLKKIN